MTAAAGAKYFTSIILSQHQGVFLLSPSVSLLNFALQNGQFCKMLEGTESHELLHAIKSSEAYDIDVTHMISTTGGQLHSWCSPRSPASVWAIAQL